MHLIRYFRTFSATFTFTKVVILSSDFWIFLKNPKFDLVFVMFKNAGRNPTVKKQFETATRHFTF